MSYSDELASRLLPIRTCSDLEGLLESQLSLLSSQIATLRNQAMKLAELIAASTSPEAYLAHMLITYGEQSTEILNKISTLENYLTTLATLINSKKLELGCS